MYLYALLAQVDFSNPAVNPAAKYNSIATFTNLLVPLMMIVGGLMALLMLMYGAFQYLRSEGNPEAVKKAQSTLVYALIGIFLIFASFVITKIIGFVFKVQMPL